MSKSLDDWLHQEGVADPKGEKKTSGQKDDKNGSQKQSQGDHSPEEKKEISFVRGLFGKGKAEPKKHEKKPHAHKAEEKKHENKPYAHKAEEKKHEDKKPHHRTPHHSKDAGKPHPQKSHSHSKAKGKGGKCLKFIALGGLEEIGRNCAAFEYDNDMFLFDVGLQFPEPDLMGIDYIVPDVTYVEQNIKKLRAIVITHGHLDHIGALKVILPKLGFPLIYGPALALGLIKKQMEEIGMANKLRMKVVKPHDVITIGKMKVEFFRVNHSIPDGHGVVIESPDARIVHTGDFKFDFTPANDEPADLTHMAEIGRRGVDLLMVDSTNATSPGHTKSEKIVGESLERIVKDADGRVIVATFSSLIGRIQQLIEYAQKYGRTVYLSGRSMLANVEIAKNLGFISYPPGAVRRIGPQTNNLPDDKVMIITTGCQGEEMSALARMAFGSHRHIKIRRGDTIVLSSNPIPGNERGVYNLMNNLSIMGANIIDNDAMDVHTSGHARQDDIKLMISLIKPKHYLPVHGEIYMRVANGKIAQEMSIPEKNVFRIPNGGILEFRKGQVEVSKEQLDIGFIMIDGSSEGMSGSKVVSERQIMSRDGVIVLNLKVDKKTKHLVAAPKVISKGFIYMEELSEITKSIISETKRIYEKILSKRDSGKTEKQLDVIRALRADIARHVESRTGRVPMILPIITEI